VSDFASADQVVRLQGELASRVLDLMAQHPAWHLPLGYKDGEYGAERVPSGAYLGDRDMFLFVRRFTA
jgi:hypothetical protein